MKWIRHGKIFDPSDHHLDFECNDFAQSPQTLVKKDRVRIYFSTRKKDSTGKYLSNIVFVDFTKDLQKVMGFSTNDVIRLGGLGSFDEHGIFPINILNFDENVWAYTCGWSRRVSVSVETSTGLAISKDGGQTFDRFGEGPVLSSSLYEPMLVGDSFVKKYGDIFHMWYIFGTRWMDVKNEPSARVYKIGYASSLDGVNWIRNEGKQIITDVLGDDECQALPTVIKIGDVYHMYFCFRYATDFRTNPKRGYRLGYAYSTDMMNWTRDDQLGGMNISKEGWDSEMMCYPHIFDIDSKVYLLYNGNEFGKFGFGLAELIDE